MFSLLTVLILGYSGVHVCLADCSNVTIYVKIPINQTFGFETTLSFQISIHTTAMLNLGDILITQGLKTRIISLNI